MFPFSTVRCSSVGCQCAGILEPSKQRMRSTNGAPSAFMSPSTGATSHPLMIGVHFKSPKCTILWASAGSFFSWLYICGASTIDAAANAKIQITRFLFMNLSSVGVHRMRRRYRAQIWTARAKTACFLLCTSARVLRMMRESSPRAKKSATLASGACLCELRIVRFWC